MPRITPKSRAALDILDWFLFNQTWFIQLCKDVETLHEGSPEAEELIALHKIARRVNEEVDNTGATGISAQAMKHTIYCFLEALFSDDLVQKSRSGHADRFNMTDEQGTPLSKSAEDIDPAQSARVHQHDQHFFIALTASISESFHGVCKDTALSIATTIGAEFSDAPTAIKYRITERVFILEFMNAPVMFLSWMYRIGVLTSAKFVARDATRDITEDFKARVCLLCEFAIMRDFIAISNKTHGNHATRHLQVSLKDKLSRAALDQLRKEDEFYWRRYIEQDKLTLKDLFNLERLEDEAYLHHFLKHFAGNHLRSRFWIGHQHSWTGVVGAGMIRVYHELVDKKRRITRNGNNYSKSDKTIVPEESVAERICKNLKEYGLVCRPNSLYETYIEHYMKQPDGLYHKANMYHSQLRDFDVVFPPYIHDVLYLGIITTTTPSKKSGNGTRIGHKLF